MKCGCWDCFIIGGCLNYGADRDSLVEAHNRLGRDHILQIGHHTDYPSSDSSASHHHPHHPHHHQNLAFHHTAISNQIEADKKTVEQSTCKATIAPTEHHGPTTRTTQAALLGSQAQIWAQTVIAGIC